MSLVYKCNFYNTFTVDENQYPHIRHPVIKKDANNDNIMINGVELEIKLTVELIIPTVSDKIHANGSAWRDAAGLIKDWLDATFPQA